MPAADEIIASGRLFLYHLSEYNPQTLDCTPKCGQFIGYRYKRILRYAIIELLYRQGG